MLTIMWGWFVVPTFNVKPLLMVQAIGLSMVVSFLTHQLSSDPFDGEKEPNKSIMRVMMAAITPAVVLFFSWVVQHWMP